MKRIFVVLLACMMAVNLAAGEGDAPPQHMVTIRLSTFHEVAENMLPKSVSIYCELSGGDVRDLLMECGYDGRLPGQMPQALRLRSIWLVAEGGRSEDFAHLMEGEASVWSEENDRTIADWYIPLEDYIARADVPELEEIRYSYTFLDGQPCCFVRIRMEDRDISRRTLLTIPGTAVEALENGLVMVEGGNSRWTQLYAGEARYVQDTAVRRFIVYEASSNQVGRDVLVPLLEGLVPLP